MAVETNTAFGNLYDAIIQNPYNDGYRQLTAVTGFASAALVRQILQVYPDVNIKLIIGMARGSGISDADHRMYCELTESHAERFHCFYYVRQPLVHAKFYTWQINHDDRIGIITSANFSWTGLGQYFEACAFVEAAPLHEKYNELRQNSIAVTNLEVSRYIRIFEASQRTAPAVRITHGSIQTSGEEAFESIDLSLLTQEGTVHTASGLNWGQRSGREPNQAYIPIPVSIHREHPDFFPPRGQRFIMKTDDGTVLTCVTAQDNAKAIETPDDNSMLGLYIRNRLGVASGEFVTLEDLNRYGRTSVKITKIDEDIFLMDYSRP